MKSKKIDKLRYEDKDGIEILLGFAILLESLGIKQAEYTANEFQHILDEEFCGECGSSKDYCECRTYDMEDRSDYYYDQWKDQQLEKEGNND